MADSKEGTWIDGIASSEHLDSSGERIEISGVDISSLDKSGVFNFEHDSSKPASIVGKIFEAKKIVKKSDCDNERHEYYWDKIKMPFIYVAGELFDGEGHEQAKEVAAMLRYDSSVRKNGKNKDIKNTINFSIEGSKLKKEGQVIKKCIARKVSITIFPCNKACEAEAMPIEDKKDDLLLSILGKNEESFCEIMKAIPKYSTSLAPVKLKQRKSPKEDYVPQSKVSATMRTGTGESESRPAKEMQIKRKFTDKDAPKELKPGDRVEHRSKKMRTGAEIYNDPDTWKSDKKMKVSTKEMVEEHKKLIGVLESPSHKDDKKEAKKQKKELKGYKKKLSKYDSNVRKALVAGSGMAAPSAKVGVEALASEEIVKTKKKLSFTKKEVMKKLSEDNWKTFAKKEELIDFVCEKFPKIKPNEVLALAKTVAYYNVKKNEQELSKILEKDID